MFFAYKYAHRANMVWKAIYLLINYQFARPIRAIAICIHTSFDALAQVVEGELRGNLISMESLRRFLSRARLIPNMLPGKHSLLMMTTPDTLGLPILLSNARKLKYYSPKTMNFA